MYESDNNAKKKKHYTTNKRKIRNEYDNKIIQ